MTFCSVMSLILRCSSPGPGLSALRLEVRAGMRGMVNDRVGGRWAQEQWGRRWNEWMDRMMELREGSKTRTLLPETALVGTRSKGRLLLPKDCWPSTAVTTEGGRVKASSAQPFSQLQQLPQDTNSAHEGGSSKSKREGQKRKETGSQNKMLQPSEAAKLKALREGIERTSTIIFATTPQVLPTLSFQISIQISPAAASQRSANRPGCVPMPLHSLRSDGRGFVVKFG